MERTKTCPTCGKNFSYMVGRGNDRKYCGANCKVIHQLQNRKQREHLLPRCSVSGCSKPATRVGSGLCETHFYRIRRTGTTNRKEMSGRYWTTAGYIKLLQPKHPLADSNGSVFEHRWVMYEITEGECPKCYWCGCDLTWPEVVIDHLNEVKHDNNPDNLVPSCNNCNRARGAFVPFIKRMLPGSFDLLIDAFCEVKRLGNGAQGE